jgi:hypothetical protein
LIRFKISFVCSLVAIWLRTPFAKDIFVSCKISMDFSMELLVISLKKKNEMNLNHNPLFFYSLEDVNVILLPHSVDAVHGLCLKLRVPVVVGQNYVVASSQINPCSTSNQRH